MGLQGNHRLPDGSREGQVLVTVSGACRARGREVPRSAALRSSSRRASVVSELWMVGVRVTSRSPTRTAVHHAR